MNKLLDKYDFCSIEKQIIEYWKNNHLAQPNFKDANNFTIVIPPPNVTGHLHLGHAWDGVIQDAIIRYKRLQHFNSIWIPGTDHAGIATQVKFEKYLKEQNLTKDSLGKDKFLKEIYKWKNLQSQFIHTQWDEMGFLLDYTKERFTLDEQASKAVLNSFIKLYKEGLIYQGYKLVNWDSTLKTAISDIEVIYKETNSKFYYINYDVINDKKEIVDHLLVATTRPETMFGDVCLVINPNDERYLKYANYHVINPANNEILPIIQDSYVDISFGTGVMKCTPAHDFNDYELAKKHHLKMINILNDDATLNNVVPKEYISLSVEEARDKLVKQLELSNHIDHIENVNNRVGYSERTNVIVQPYLTKQWFLKTSVLAQDVIKIQESNKKVDFLPPRFEKTLVHWLNNMQDWTISRQLWWGHQLPIWFNNKNPNEIYCEVNPPKDIQNWTRSTHVLDTWFSSGLWPLITLGWDGLEHQKPNELFPSQILVTGYDIIFFWIARMMMFSAYFLKQRPFEKVYIHGLVKDEQNRKMSKSLGNGIEPKTLIHEYGNDAIRIFFLSDCSEGEDISYKPAKLKQAFNFLIKIWNTAKFIELNNFAYDDDFKIDLVQTNAIEKYILFSLQETLNIIKTNLDKYSFNIAYKYLKDFVWDSFCNFYLECMKKQEFKNAHSQKLFMFVWKNILMMLQTFTPFISEYLYLHQINNKHSILKEEWLKSNAYQIKNTDEITNVTLAKELLNKIRKARNDFNIPNTEKIKLTYTNLNQTALNTINVILELANACLVNNNETNLDKFVIVINEHKFNLLISNLKKQEYLKKLETEINKLNNEIKRSEQILNNKEFIKKASSEKVQIEQEKYQKYQSELITLKKELEELKN